MEDPKMANITSVVGNLSGTITYTDNHNRYFHGQVERIDPNRNLIWATDAAQSEEAYRTLLCTLANYATLAVVFQTAPFITTFTAITPAYPQICAVPFRDIVLHINMTITYDDGHIQPVSITRTAKAIAHDNPLGITDHTDSAPNLVAGDANITELLTLIYNAFQQLGISIQLQYAGVTVPHLSRRQTRKATEAAPEAKAAEVKVAETIPMSRKQARQAAEAALKTTGHQDNLMGPNPI